MTSKKTKSWNPLCEGDSVAIVAPGFASSLGELKKATRFIEAWGFRPQVPKGIYGSDVLCSNSDSQRFKHLKWAIEDKTIKAVWCIRGGYGALRLLPLLKGIKPPTQPKIFLGYSDAVSIHLYMHKFWEWPTLHASLLDGILSPERRNKDKRDLKSVLCGDLPEMYFDSLTPLNRNARKKTNIVSTVEGGNLMVIQSSIGTPFEPSFRGKILFFEEVGERGYRVDRALEHLRQSGLFKGVRAIIFGDFIGGREPSGGPLGNAVIERFAQTIDVPVLKGLPVGHGRRQAPLPLGTKAYLTLGSTAKLRVSTGCSGT